MNALNRYVLGPLRDPSVWLNRLSGEVNANRARATLVDNAATPYPFVTKYSDFVSSWKRPCTLIATFTHMI